MKPMSTLDEARLYKMSPIERYQRDPEFNQLVDMMQAMIHQAQFSPSELREAAVLAATMYEERRNISRYGLARAPAHTWDHATQTAGGYEPDPIESEE